MLGLLKLRFEFFFLVHVRDVEAVHHAGGGGARRGGQEPTGFTQQAGFCQHWYMEMLSLNIMQVICESLLYRLLYTCLLGGE